ncbi:hypothetical protein A3B02_01155 [Candidatus Roizmanbacteria bacterium RIFCSPLOWO2_01_FULL_42_14]|uniref:Tr-type G domain-containing protein n=4 Tax=Candidatus Roizmaniibacteriota TaxID=1752723 RepID=A0A1F7K017_9BACT|nr:MAG: hypothetical protein A3D08_01755 [Candidatus Roizmanbacteria bacterium RIFCSPHIGHO2_02_FULL_43_11]OGK37764.1 MAG: hypothetical protein A3F32_00950 [Candidatus Roizmanbacteria bacterium RIFCSPHIGHO2_12_FULL_42_10]OGK51371.1 MAG: hypothetical protein A3B02_01155 [Candidatus Roizmanbacteria bacterium RIFCSPLOWO2_01_FULL_42_14]OGK61214.1 MAG: hypothetical protein A3I56_03935 [Candidatus Roizmanbacteria bacterium RIFCSPLOWO2_02_FULL_43_10]
MAKGYRAPVVVVLGHVDHGKTTLLDYIRKSHVADKEAGKITQSIGAYSAHVPIEGYHTQDITFIDTPGHEAFTQLRVRGANIADIAILIIDASASVMPQTIESISHIQAANIPFLVAMNKVDMQTANQDKVKADLAKHGVLTEGYGGNVPAVPISALKGDGVQDLLETLLLMAAEKNFTYDTESELQAYIIETHQDRAGTAASCVIKNGSLAVGDTVFAAQNEARIKALINDSGVRVKEVVPSMPFVLFGFKEMPEVGMALTRAKGAGKLSEPSPSDVPSADPFADFFKQDEAKKLKIVLKADSAGSLEAITPALQKNDNLEVMLGGIGEILESDIFLAKVSEAIVIGFSVPVPKNVESMAKTEKVVIKTYNIIYKLLEELQEVSELIKEKEEQARTFKGEGKVQAIFHIDGLTIAGVKITKGRIDLHDRAEHIRDNALKDEAIIVSIKQRAHDVDTAKKGEEAGIQLDPQLDIKQGDVIKSYSI